MVDALKKVVNGESNLEKELAEYQEEVRARCRPAVLASRQAAFDALMLDEEVEGQPLGPPGTGQMDHTRRWVLNK